MCCAPGAFSPKALRNVPTARKKAIYRVYAWRRIKRRAPAKLMSVRNRWMNMNRSVNVQNRRVVLAGLGILLGGCANVNRELLPASGRSNHVVDPRYGPINDSGYPATC